MTKEELEILIKKEYPQLDKCEIAEAEWQGDSILFTMKTCGVYKPKTCVQVVPDSSEQFSSTKQDQTEPEDKSATKCDNCNMNLPLLGENLCISCKDKAVEQVSQSPEIETETIASDDDILEKKMNNKSINPKTRANAFKKMSVGKRITILKDLLQNNEPLSKRDIAIKLWDADFENDNIYDYTPALDSTFILYRDNLKKIGTGTGTNPPKWTLIKKLKEKTTDEIIDNVLKEAPKMPEFTKVLEDKLKSIGKMIGRRYEYGKNQSGVYTIQNSEFVRICSNFNIKANDLLEKIQSNNNFKWNVQKATGFKLDVSKSYKKLDLVVLGVFGE